MYGSLLSNTPATDSIEPSLATEIEAAALIETHRLLVARTSWLTLYLTVMVALTWLLELFGLVSTVASTFTVRLIFVCFALSLALALRTIPGRRWVVPLSSCMFILLSIVTGSIARAEPDFHQAWTQTQLLNLLGAALILPWRLHVYSASAVAGTLCFLWINREAPSIPGDAYTLSLTLAFGTIATTLLGQKRRTEVALRLKLEQANATLRELDEAKSTFLANISHELRTPLMLILGPLEIMQEQQRNEDERALLITCSNNARRLLRQINLLLDLSKAEAKRFQLSFATGNLGALLSEMLSSISGYAAHKDIELRSSGLEAVPDNEFDSNAMETAVANILSNAIKYTPAGGTIDVRMSSDDTHIQIDIEDTGLGIAPENCDKIFERFHQVDGNPSGLRGGAGIGLALVREIVTGHGGLVGVRSELGEGSTFTLRIPRVPPLAAVLRQHSDSQKPGAGSTDLHRFSSESLLADMQPTAPDTIPELQAVASTEAPRLLIAEDNAEMRHFLQRSFAAEYRTTAVADGLEAFEAACGGEYDAIVSDIMMPHLDGYQLCERLRRETRHKSTPIILLTAKSDTESVVLGLDRGADDYLAKPFEMRELRARVAAHVRSHRLQQQLGERDSRLAAIGKMTGTLVHDIRSPLTAIQFISELGQDPSEVRVEKLKQALQTIEEQTKRIANVITEVLEYSRGTEISLQLQSTSVGQFVQEFCDSHRQRLEQQDTILVCSSGDPEVTAQLDEERMNRILDNLLTNAVEATQGAPESPSIIWVYVSSDQSEVNLCVADNGPGIMPELRDKLFEPFTSFGKAKGTGLGLATVRNLVRAHGGSIDLVPPPEGATTAFGVRLPRD